jgi:hypothetical protein
MSNQNKNQHYITLIAGSHTTKVDINLTVEEYELLNRISTLTCAEADVEAPVLFVSKRIPTFEDEKEEITLNTSTIPIVKPDTKPEPIG